MKKQTDFLDLLEEFILKSRDEYERVQQELRENDELVRQSTSEVERLAQRNSQLRSKVATMESTLDDYSRAEIKSLYQAANEAQIRLFMMRNRVEQLQNKQQILERYTQSLQNFVSLSQFLPTKEELEGMQESAMDEKRNSGTSLSMGRVIEAQEAERFTLARQMHDGPAQSLTNLILQAELCERLFARDPELARQELGNLKGFANTTFQKIRDFIFELRPMILDDLGLIPTLKRYLKVFEEQYGLNIRAQYVGQEQRLPPEMEITLFRAVQELLNNVVRHAHATQTQLTVDLQGRNATVVVEDNGSGFSVAETLSDRTDTETVGLTALRERIEMLGGEISFDSAVGRGTRVNIQIPVTAQSGTQLLVG